MKQLVLLSGLLLFFFSCSEKEETVGEKQAEFKSEIVFTKSYGGSLDETVNGVVKTNDGGMIIIGHTNSNDGDIDKLHGKIDIWITKLDSNGNKVWSKTIGGSKNDYGTSIIATNDGNFVIAGYSESTDEDVPGNVGLHDFFISKINNEGTIIWKKNYGFTGHDHAHKIIQTKDGGYFVTGFAEYEGIQGSGGTENNGAGHEIGHRGVLHGSGEYLGIKLDNQGDFLWYRYFGGTQNDRVNDVVEANDGGFVLVGYSESTNFDITDNKGSYDYWIVKIHSDGALHWKHNFGGSGIDQAFGVAKTGNNSYLIAGKSNSTDKDITKNNGGFDAWIIHIDDHGHLIWEKSFGSSGFDVATSIRSLNNGNFGIVGNTRSTFGNKPNKGQNDFWMFEIDNKPNTSIFWQNTFGGSNVDFATDFLQTSNNEIVIIGESQSNDQEVQQNKGGTDLFLLKLK